MFKFTIYFIYFNMGNKLTKSSIENAIDNNDIELFDKLINKNNITVDSCHLDLSLENNKYDIWPV